MLKVELCEELVLVINRAEDVEGVLDPIALVDETTVEVLAMAKEGTMLDTELLVEVPTDVTGVVEEELATSVTVEPEETIVDTWFEVEMTLLLDN